MKQTGPTLTMADISWQAAARSAETDSNETRLDCYAHETAVVESGCAIGTRTKVWHHSHVRADSVIGSDCVIGKNVYVDTQVVVGDRCKIQNNVSLYRGVHLDDDVFVGPSATFTNDRVPRAFNESWVIFPTRVGRGASIGANATIICGVRIGEFAMVAAGATVTHDVNPHQLVMGTPARHGGWVCNCGAVVSREVEPPLDAWCGSCAKSDHS